MKKTDLQARNLKDLKAIASKMGIKRPSSGKEDLITEILAAERVKSLKGGSPRKVALTRTTPSASRSSARAKATPPAEELKKTPKKRRAAPAATPPLPAAAEHKFDLPSHPIPASSSSPYDNLGELPDSYGTGRLFLTARDPNWLYAYWDYTWQQMEDMRRGARHGELKLKIHSGRDPESPVQQEITLNPATRNWFVNVGHANSDYFAQIGYYNHEGAFICTSRSRPAHTPPSELSSNTSARFVTIPFHITFRELMEIVRAHFKDGEELADVLYRLQASGFRFPFDYPFDADETSPVENLLGTDLFQRVRMGSEELTRWIQRRIKDETSSGLFSMSSPFGASFGAPSSRGFWFKVNAELIVYGATEPKSRVVFDGKEIALKPDGSFRFQFALPDGTYHLPITATSPDQAETRGVQLSFGRTTAEEGDVGTVPHPQGLTSLTPSKS